MPHFPLSRRKALRIQDSHQLPLEWKPPAPVPALPAAAAPLPLPAAGTQGTLPPSKPARAKRRLAPKGRIVARLPVPRPNAASVAAGHFGYDDDGKVIRPQADEIRAITENLAERLIELLDALKEATPADTKRALQEQFSQGIDMYALEFGQPAADQLAAFVRRQSSLEDDDRADRNWGR